MKSNPLIGLTLAALLGWGAAADAQAYRWVDEKGQVHYSNIRPSRPAPPEAPAPARPPEPEAVKGPETVKGPEPKTSTPAAQARPDQRPPIEEILKATSTKKQEQEPGVGQVLGTLVMVLGYIVVVGGGIWLIVVGLKQSVLEGLLMLFISPYQLVFVFRHWQESKRPFLLQLAGAALVIIGGVIAASSGRAG